jgi:hypothetical protein
MPRLPKENVPSYDESSIDVDGYVIAKTPAAKMSEAAAATTLMPAQPLPGLLAPPPAAAAAESPTAGSDRPLVHAGSFNDLGEHATRRSSQDGVGVISSESTAPPRDMSFFGNMNFV